MFLEFYIFQLYNSLIAHEIPNQSLATGIRMPLDSKDEEYNYSEQKKKNYIHLPMNDFEKDKLIGPSNRWHNIQSHNETMNNKENFGGDMDDIEEISEFVDENSRFVYTSEEDNENDHQSIPIDLTFR